MFANCTPPPPPPPHTKPSSDLDARKETLASWRNLEEEISDLQDLIAQFSNIVTVAAGVRQMRQECQFHRYGNLASLYNNALWEYVIQ